MCEQTTGISYRVDGKRIYTVQFKQELVAECFAGATTAEVARIYQIPMQNSVKWRRQVKKVKAPEVEMSVSSSAFNKALDEIKRLQNEVKKLCKSLSNMYAERSRKIN